jgi:signal transduction histidine kinase
MILFKSIYMRLFLPIVGTLFLAIVLSAWIATSLLTTTLEQRLVSQLEHATEVLAQGRFSLTKELLFTVKNLLRADIILIRHDNSIGPSTLGSDDQQLARLLLNAWRNMGQTTRHFNLQNEHVPYTAFIRKLPKERDNRYAAVIALSSLSDIQSGVQKAAWWLTATALAGTVLLGLVGHRIAQSITIPLKNLADLAARIANGDRSGRVDIYRHDEVGELTAALNTMLEKLSHYEQQLAENARLAAVGKTAARVAHEIRNPLTAIKMQVQLLGESQSGNYKDTITTVLEEIRRLELIVTGTLEQTRPTQLNCQLTDLNALIMDVLNLMKMQFEHRGIRLDSQLQNDLPQTNIDSDRIKQVLVNLIVNAGEELKNGGTVRIRTRHDSPNNKVILEVEDSGTGVPTEQREKLFTVNDSSKPGGFGLGLKLSKELVQLHNGTLVVDDSELGGALFRIAIPVEV